MIHPTDIPLTIYVIWLFSMAAAIVLVLGAVIRGSSKWMYAFFVATFIMGMSAATIHYYDLKLAPSHFGEAYDVGPAITPGDLR